MAWMYPAAIRHTTGLLDIRIIAVIVPITRDRIKEIKEINRVAEMPSANSGIN
jgi:hypothetical protein